MINKYLYRKKGLKIFLGIKKLRQDKSLKIYISIKINNYREAVYVDEFIRFLSSNSACNKIDRCCSLSI
jgi:hypothetical protein